MPVSNIALLLLTCRVYNGRFQKRASTKASRLLPGSSGAPGDEASCSGKEAVSTTTDLSHKETCAPAPRETRLHPIWVAKLFTRLPVLFFPGHFQLLLCLQKLARRPLQCVFRCRCRHNDQHHASNMFSACFLPLYACGLTASSASTSSRIHIYARSKEHRARLLQLTYKGARLQRSYLL